MTNEMIITILAALFAGASFAGFAFPFLQRSDQKQKTKSIIEKRRQDLYKTAREGPKVVREETISAADSLAMTYKFQKLAGSMGESARDKMLQAGIRNPKAHLKFMISRVVLPIVFSGLCALYFNALPEEKQYSNGVVALLTLAVAVFGFKLPDILVKNIIVKRQQEIKPDIS